MKEIEHHLICVVESNIVRQDRIEIPCKDLDLDCMPDESGQVPFGSYENCYKYAPEQGICPLTPINRTNKTK